MRLEQIITAWESYHRDRLSLRPQTITTYHHHLLRFERDHAGIKTTGITEEVCQIWIGKETRRSKHTGNSSLAALRSLFKYMVMKGYFAADLTVTIEPCEVPEPNRQPTPEADIARLIAVLDGYSAGKQVVYRARLFLMVHGGLRVSEVAAFKLSDMNRDTGELTVPDGKGGRLRRIYPAPECVAAVLQWGDGKPADSTFGVKEVALRQWLARLCLRADVDVNTPHQLRHAAATRLYDNGAKLFHLMRFLGHRQLTTTQKYLHLDHEGMKGLAALSSLNYEAAQATKDYVDDKGEKKDKSAQDRTAKRVRVNLRQG